MNGIDVSEWQGDINWKAVKAYGVQWVILREGKRNQIDKRFLQNVSGAKGAGVPVRGVYHFIYTDGATPEQNADATVRSMSQAGLSLSDTWVFADLEYDTWTKNGEAPTREKCTEYTRRYLDRMKWYGARKLGIYLNLDYHKNYYTEEILSAYPLWLADYKGEADFPCMIQQTGSTGHVDGINGNVDTDIVTDAKAWDRKDTNMSKTEGAVQWMINHANDNRYGYDQTYRWGEKGDYDCSAAVITAWQSQGVPVKTNGATYTGNMRPAFLKSGFTDVTSRVNLATGAGLIRGDVLLNTGHHTAMYIGNGQTAEASINEKGTARGGRPGDQTGREFLIRSYRNFPWNYVLRYKDAGTAAAAAPSAAPSASVDQLARDVIAGKYGTGDARKRALGSRYDEVQARVNQILSGSKTAAAPAFNVEQAARDVIAGKYGTGDARKKALGSHYNEVQARVNQILGAQKTPSVDITAEAKKVIRGEYGNGAARTQALTRKFGASVAQQIQKKVNQLL